ncbi:MAG: SMP-30/gluconolactonase/LRE family protein [Proteobacteria bacterium]|nr:SMP-30/gluconolactonase/LRE family protein [Pseudomonadota bacterium]MDA0992683.1 SMP-30/gluconolactonase/LRE family protein [Pseudomonadota bacterium]
MFLVFSLFLYLFLWPVPLEPVAWVAPTDAGLVDPFEPNDRLRSARYVDLGVHEGPEDIARGPDGLLYTATSDGNIIRFDQNGSSIETFADAGGRPLGMEFDTYGNLIVANAYLGLQRISRDGQVSTLVDEFNGKKIVYADDVAIANDGIIYFSDASSKFGASISGGSYVASVLDIMEHGGHGRVFRHDPAIGETLLVLDGLNFANGVAVSEDQRYLLINETGSYRILRYWLSGPDQGRREVIIDNLPGFPDNINNGLNGKFWVGLIAPRNELLDQMAPKPWLRKLVQRLPASVRPQAAPSSHVIAITGDGEVLMNLQDTSARLPALTGVFETRDVLWLSTLFGNRVGRLDKQDLAR